MYQGDPWPLVRMSISRHSLVAGLSQLCQRVLACSKIGISPAFGLADDLYIQFHIGLPVRKSMNQSIFVSCLGRIMSFSLLGHNT